MKSRTVALITLIALSGAAPAMADADKGEKNFRQCAACHSVEVGKNRVGPSLHGLFGREAGTAPKYKYSKDLAAAGEKGLVWSDETVFEYLADPSAFLRKYLDKKSVHNKMMNKFPKEDFRRDVIDYLKMATK